MDANTVIKYLQSNDADKDVVKAIQTAINRLKGIKDNESNNTNTNQLISDFEAVRALHRQNSSNMSNSVTMASVIPNEVWADTTKLNELKGSTSALIRYFIMRSYIFGINEYTDNYRMIPLLLDNLIKQTSLIVNPTNPYAFGIPGEKEKNKDLSLPDISDMDKLI